MPDLGKSCRTFGDFILFYFLLAQCGKILAQFLCKSFILFYFILLQMGKPLYSFLLSSTTFYLLSATVGAH